MLLIEKNQFQNSSQAPAPASLALPIFIGLVLRLLFLTRQSLWVDEVLTLEAASVGGPFHWSDVFANPQGPLPHVLLRTWTAVFGATDFSLRLWSSLAGIAGLGIGALWFREAFPRIAVILTWFLALNPFHLWYSHEVRNYVFLMAFTFLVLASLQSWKERATAVRWLALTLSLGGLLLCNMSGVFLLPAIGMAVLGLSKHRILGVAGACVGALVMASPWIYRELTGHVAWDAAGVSTIRGGDPFQWEALGYTWVAFIGGFGITPSLRSLHESVTLETWIPHLPLLVLLAAAFFAAAWGVLKSRGTWEIKLCLWTVFLPVVLASIVAIMGLKAFSPRYVSVSLPPFLVLVVTGAWYWRERSNAAASGILAVLLAASVVGWTRQTFDPDYAREDLRGAAAWVESLDPSPDLVLMQGAPAPFLRYYQGSPTKIYWAAYFAQGREGRDKLNELLGGAERVVWLGTRLWYEDPERKVFGWLEEDNPPLERHHSPGVEAVLFQRSPR